MAVEGYLLWKHFFSNFSLSTELAGLFERVVTLDCQGRRCNLSIAWVDAKKVYDSVDHGWLGEMMVLHGFPKWLGEVICKLCKSWNTRIGAKMSHGQEIS